jgi:hypothetical protein
MWQLDEQQTFGDHRSCAAIDLKLTSIIHSSAPAFSSILMAPLQSASAPKPMLRQRIP